MVLNFALSLWKEEGEKEKEENMSLQEDQEESISQGIICCISLSAALWLFIIL